MSLTGFVRDARSGRKFLLTGLHLVAVLAVCCWFLYTFHNYLPALDAAAFQETIASIGDLLARWGILDILFVAWIWLAAYLLGRKFLDLLGICLVSGTERRWLCSTLGLSVLSLAVFLLAALQILHRGEAYVLLSLPLLISLREMRQMTSKLWRGQLRIPRPLSGRNLAHFFLVAYIAVVLAVVFLSALGPEVEYDPLAMHLYAAKTIAQQHSLQAIPEVPQTFLPKNVTMLFSLGMLLHGQICVKLINFLLGLLALLGAYTLTTRCFSRSTGLVAVAVLASSPLLMWEMRTAHLDAGFTLFVFLAVFSTLLWLQTSQRPWFYLAVYSTAFSLGTKYQALFPLGGLATAVLLDQLMKRESLYAAGKRAVKFFLLAMMGLVPWAIVNLIQTGNPLFPFLNGFFHSPYWNVPLTQRVVWQMHDSGIPIQLSHGWSIVTNFWHLGVNQVDFHGNIGPFYVLLIPLLVFHRRIHSVIKFLLIVSLVYWLLWLFTGQHARYFLAALPGLAILAAYALVNFLEWVQGRVGRPLAGAVAILLMLLAVFNSPLFEKYGANPRYGARLWESVPGKYLLGLESRNTYLSRYLLDYPVVQHLNQLPGQKRVLFWWNTDPIAFYLDGETALIYSHFVDKLEGQDPAELARVLQENGITHFVVGQLYADSNYISNPENEFVQRYLRKIYQRNSVNLYEVSSQPLRQEIVAYDFLNHVEDATIKIPGEPPGKPNSDYWGVFRIGEEDRYALLTHPPAEVDFEVTLPELPRIRFAVGRRWPPCETEGSFQLWIQAAEGERERLYERVTKAQNPIDYVAWFDEEVDLSAYSGQRVRFTFQSEWEGGGGCDWFFWGHPQIIALP